MQVAVSVGLREGKILEIERSWIKKREDFFKYHEYLQANGIETSEIGGFMDRGMVSFHFNFVIFYDKGIVMLAAAHGSASKSRTNLKAFYSIDTKHGFT